MSAITSDTAICNLALGHLKQEPIAGIASPSPESVTETLCALYYDMTRRALLRAHPWSFARSRVQVSRNATAPVFGYADAYNLPNDFIRVLFLGDNYASDYVTDYSIEGNQILINNAGADSLNLGYVKDITAVTKFDPLFIKLLALELAATLAPSLLGMKPAMITQIISTRDEVARLARSVNGQDNPIKVRRTSAFASARTNGRNVDPNLIGW